MSATNFLSRIYKKGLPSSFSVYTNNHMEIEFDPAKDIANIEAHGLSLAEFEGFDDEMIVVIDDRRDYGESRYRGFGRINGVPHMVAFTYRGETIRLISFRRAHEKELGRYG